MSRYDNYDYLDIYNNEVLGVEGVEEKIEELRRSKKKCKYMVKTIKSGNILECEIYPVYERRKDVPRRPKEFQSALAQKNLNDKNARKYFVRLVNTNFSNKDIVITLTYKDRYLPTQERAKKDMNNYIAKLRRYRKKNNLPELKYIYVIEWIDEVNQHKSKKVRMHHHIIINEMDRDIAESFWNKGRVESKRLQPDEYGLEGLARYMLKQQKGQAKYTASRNLDKPKIYKSVSKLTKRKAERIAKNPNQWKELFESLYIQKYIFNDCSTMVSDFTGGFYLYCRMRKRI